MELFFDTETSGLPMKGESIESPNYPWIVQLAFVVSTEDRVYTQFSTLIHPLSQEPIHPKAQEVHGISKEEAMKGMWESDAISILADKVMFVDIIVSHNFDFDIGLINASLHRTDQVMPDYKSFCTMKATTNICKLPGKFGKYKWPKLEELYHFLFNEDFEGAHDALSDVMATRKCYYELKKRELI